MYQLIIVINVFIFLFTTPTTMTMKEDWTYELIGIECECENPDLLNIDLELTRVARDDYRVSGIFETNIDFTDEEFIEFAMYRSVTGSRDDYRKLPFRYPKNNLTKAVKEFYIPLVMPKYQKCAPQAPQLDETFKPPLKAPIKVEVTNCIGNSRNLPTTMYEGYYKLVTAFSGQANASIITYAKITKKIV